MTVESPGRPLLVFDGDCPVCVSTVEALEKAGLVPAARRRAYQAFEGDVSARLWDAGIRNEIAVLDESTGVIESGVPAAQIVTEAFGKTSPRRPNTTKSGEDDPSGRRANRRTEIYLDF